MFCVQESIHNRYTIFAILPECKRPVRRKSNNTRPNIASGCKTWPSYIREPGTAIIFSALRLRAACPPAADNL